MTPERLAEIKECLEDWSAMLHKDEVMAELIAALESSQAECERLRAALEVVSDDCRLSVSAYMQKYGVLPSEELVLARIDAALAAKGEA